jgi:carboxymethylenebutenolidase
MGASLHLTAEDGHELDAYCALPDEPPRGGLVVLQEIFGLNGHIRDVCDGFAAEGYAVIAPALFDRLERGVELAYTPEDAQHGRALRTKLGWELPLLDLRAAMAALRPHGKVGAVGFCWGGSWAWLCACRTDVACAVGYYGGQIAQFVEETPRAPVLLHFGEKDTYIPPADIERIRAAHPEVTVYLYPAGHGFNCDRRADHDAASAALARGRTLAFLAEHLAGGGTR